MRIDFHASPEPTLGVEWELMLVDRVSRDLVSSGSELHELAGGRLDEPSRLHKELLRNTVEIVTGICDTVGEAVTDLRDTLAVVAPAARELGVDLLGAGSHPFADWSHQQLTEGHRYAELINRTQWWGRQMLIWGVHVHVGMPERDRVMPVLASMLTTYPHLLALSASSPIWAGQDTGYASNRALMFQQLPTAGLPFTFDTWSEFEKCIDDQTTTGIIDSMSDVRWDLRPAPHLGTLEHRVCDGMSDLGEIAALTALVHCLVVDLDTRLADGEALPTMPPWQVQENKWRAARYGLDAIVILDDRNRERLVTDDLDDLLERLTPVARRLGCEAELRTVADIPTRGASYQRQRAVAHESGGDLVAVVDALVAELDHSLRVPETSEPPALVAVVTGTRGCPDALTWGKWRRRTSGQPDRPDCDRLPARREPQHADARRRAPALREARGRGSQLRPRDVRADARRRADRPALPQAPAPLRAHGRPAGVAARRAVRHRAPRPPQRAAQARPDPRAPRALLAAAQHPPRLGATAVGGHRHRGPARRPRRDVHQDPPRPRRRRLGDAAARQRALDRPRRAQHARPVGDAPAQAARGGAAGTTAVPRCPTSRPPRCVRRSRWRPRPPGCPAR